MSDAAGWVAVNLQGQVVVGEAMAPCQVVTLSSSGLVLLPQMKGAAGMALIVELQAHHWPQAIQLPGVLVREGEYHGHYAWQVQFDPLSEPATRGLWELMGLTPEPSRSEVIPGADMEEPPPRKVERRTYSDVFSNLPDIDGVSDVEESRYDEDSGVLMQPKDKDLLKSIDQDSVKKIYKEALRQLDTEKSKDKKKKGWFG